MRMLQIAEGECYHIYNRGMHKREIFRDDRDRLRFLFLITHFQSDVIFPHIEYDLAKFNKSIRKHSVSTSDSAKEIILGRRIELMAFTLMPNHFHIIVRQVSENGIPVYMQRILNSYTKFFNTKYEESGHLFQGPYRIVYIENNDQLLYTSAYIHRNCRELGKWKNRENDYYWSSFRDYVGETRFGELLQQNLILDQFDSKEEYHKFVDNSSAKDLEGVEI